MYCVFIVLSVFIILLLIIYNYIMEPNKSLKVQKISLYITEIFF